MNESNSKPEKSQRERRFDPELLKKGLRCDLDQLDMLKRCSDKKDMTDWNEWRKENWKEDILLEGANLYRCYLKGAFLNESAVRDLSQTLFFFDQILETGEYDNSAGEVHLEWADLRFANLEGALLYEAHLERSNLDDARLGGADFWHAYLQGAGFHTAIVDGATVLWRPKVNRGTDFRGVSLGAAGVDAGTKQLLEYNIRRKNWDDWYKEHVQLKFLVHPFWLVSDYGRSTGRIMLTFLVLALVFAAVYWLWPSCIMVNGEVGNIRGFWHALYFSVVTMTTLGFGDIAANPDSWAGQTLLMIQVILGYVLLGALVTRFAVLFTAGGPAGKFTDEEEKEDEKK